jgi:hypothetical protein
MWNPDASGARLAVPDAIGSLSFASVDTAPERAPVCLAVMALALLTLVAMAASGGTPAPRDEGRAFPRAETQALAQAPTAIVPGSASTVSEKTKQRVTNAYGKLPLSFVPNKGQTDKSVRYYAEGAGHAFYFTRDKAVLSFTGKDHGVALDLTPLGANRNPTLEASGRQTGKVNYLTGSEHHVNLPTYGEVRYRELWPGVDLVFRGQGAKLKYELRLRPGADPRKIRLAYQGADGLSIGAAGNLLIHTPLGTLRDSRPRSYQRIGGRRVAVRSRYALKRGEGGYGFGVGAHDPRRPLVIDPGLAYSTYLGGASEDQARGIAVDGSGSAYVTGMTFSSDFPTTAGAFETSQSGINNDAFVTKLDASGSALSYSTYLGGANEDAGFAIAVDGSGSAYVTGYTSSSNFPTTVGAFDTSHNGENDAFVTKLDASGSALSYSTYLGGELQDQAVGIAVDGSGSAYVTGATFSSLLPTTEGALDTSSNGNNDAFVTKLGASGALSYSTYLGGAGHDRGLAIAVDGSGSAYVTGSTSSSNFPTPPGALDTSSNGNDDAFVTKLGASGSALSYSTYLGGASYDQAQGIAVDGSGSAYVTGYTSSSNFPTPPGALDTSSNGNDDAFVTKLGASGSALSYSTYLGGASYDQARGIAVDGSGSAYVTGYTSSSNFPTTAGALDTSQNGGDDAFVTKLGASGSALSYSTYLGGGSYEQAQGIAVDGSGSAYVTGYTSSSNFPTTAGALDTSQNGSYDAFLSKFADGRIVVVKDTQPDDPQDFSFTAGGGLLPSSFSLDDDSNPTLSNSRTFANLMPASGYSVSESVSVSSGWGLSSATCDDGSPVTNIDVSAGETVTCTFVNTPFVPNAVHTSLVPNFRQTIDNTQCQSRGGTPRLHGPPLAGPSCAPPKLLPGTSARMGSQGVGSVDIVAMPGTPGAPDDADISINASVTDVRNGSASGPAYDPVGAQDMSLVARVRISDDFNDNPSSPLNCASSTSCPATVSDFTLSAPVSCAPNGPGSDCSVTTTADGLIPDFVKENKQTSVQIFRPRLRDVGANGVFADVDDREAFMQGLYVRDVPAAPSPSYDVPQSADNIDVRFVPNYRETIDAMRCEQQGRYPGTHGAPDLTPASPGPDLSCSPPAYVPGTNARIAAATWGGLSVIPGDANPLTGDQADVSIQVHATDVRDDNGNEYTDAVGLVEKMRISDESNCTPGPGCPGTYQESGTLIDFHLPAQFFCVGTADPNVGATCSLNTTVDAVAPGVINEGKNMVLQVFRLRLSDSGQNGVIGDSDDREFAMQGVFVP